MSPVSESIANSPSAFPSTRLYVMAALLELSASDALTDTTMVLTGISSDTDATYTCSRNSGTLSLTSVISTLS